MLRPVTAAAAVLADTYIPPVLQYPKELFILSLLEAEAAAHPLTPTKAATAQTAWLLGLRPLEAAAEAAAEMPMEHQADQAVEVDQAVQVPAQAVRVLQVKDQLVVQDFYKVAVHLLPMLLEVVAEPVLWERMPHQQWQVTVEMDLATA